MYDCFMVLAFIKLLLILSLLLLLFHHGHRDPAPTHFGPEYGEPLLRQFLPHAGDCRLSKISWYQNKCKTSASRTC